MYGRLVSYGFWDADAAGMAQETPSFGYPVVNPSLAASVPLADLVVGPWYDGGKVSPLGSYLAPAAKTELSTMVHGAIQKRTAG